MDAAHISNLSDINGSKVHWSALEAIIAKYFRGGSWATRMTESDHQNKQSRGALKWDVLEVSFLAAVHSSTVVWGDCSEVGEGDFASLGRGRGPPTDNLCGWAWWLEDYASSFQNHFHHLPLAIIEVRINFQDFRLGQMLLSSFRVRQTPLLLQTAALSRLLLGRQNFNLIFDRNFSSIFFIYARKIRYAITRTPLHLPPKMSVGSGCDGFMLWFCPHRLNMLHLSCFHAGASAVILPSHALRDFLQGLSIGNSTISSLLFDQFKNTASIV